MKNLLLPTAYSPNIRYFREICNYTDVVIEIFENFPKQTIRNHCEILGANGVLKLVVPVIKGRGGKTKTKDIKISYQENWQRVHFKSIMSAYSASPFYEFFIDDIVNFFHKKYVFLIDYNVEFLIKLCDLISIDINVNFTDSFVSIQNDDYLDFRYINWNDEKYFKKNYIQVFSDRMKFVPNLSILDLLFNLGTESKLYLLG